MFIGIMITLLTYSTLKANNAGVGQWVCFVLAMIGLCVWALFSRML
jgi:hypothetical protein